MPASTSPRCRSKEKEPIAIIGIGARLPGGITGPASLWAALLEGRDAISEVPRDRWNIDAYYDPDRQKAGKICSKRGGFIEGMARFDAGFFGIYPKVAERMDPRQRHLLEVAYEAIEDAGLLLDQLWGSNTAVTVGVFLGDEIRKNAGSVPEAIGPHTAMGAADTTVSARLAFNFNLRGPTFSVDTACSSSLVAVHLACSAIWAGDADMALSGGVNIMADPGHSIELSKGGFLSPEGLCRAFDAQGDGYVRGEGAGVVVLKPLRQAKADGDRIYAVIRNTVVNSDGHTPEGLTVPNEGAQIAMLRKAYDDVGLCPADVDYVEAHGTGTRVGDPAETAAFGAVYAQGRPAHRPLIIGSIKTNIGHTEAVAGVAGLIKLALALHHRQIPKNLHFETPNPAIDFDRWKLRVPVASAPWPASTGPALGGVNSFGAGGTNAHAILEAHAPAPPSAHPSAPSPRRTDGPVTLEVSAKSEAALKALAEAYAGFFRQTPHTLGQIAQAIRAQRTRFPHRLLVSARAKDEAREALEAYVRDAPDDRRSTGHLDDDDAPKIAFVCSGQGPQWYAMGRQLMATSALFNETLTIIDALFEARAGYSLLREMTQPADASRIGETRIAQPAIMAMQIGLIHMWRELGVTAQGFVGHSIGEVAAAYGAGALTLEQAVDVIYNRAKEQDKASGAGVMLAVGLTREAAAQALQGLEHRISIAAVNGPEMSILSGDKPPIDALAKELEGRGVFTKYLRVNVPFHSHHMEPLEDSMLAGLAHLEPQEAALPLYSTVTGRRESGRHLTARYWYHNVRDTVRFTTAVSAMLDDGYDAFVEIAPHPVLGGNIADLLAAAGRTASVVVSARRDIPRFEAGEPYEIDVFVKAARQLSLLHVPIDWSVLNGRHEVGFVDLPRYPWQHADLWMETDAHRARRLGAPPHPFLGVSKVSAVDSAIGIHDLNLDHRVHLYLQEHQIENAAIVPATAQLEASVAVGRRLFGDAFSHLDDLRFERALFVPAPDQPPHEMRLEVFAEDGRYGIFSRAGEREPWQRHGGGRMVWGDAAHGVDAPPLEPL
ncbi:MAG: type I polyketide synthase, partial [Acidobacteriota bacterium]